MIGIFRNYTIMTSCDHVFVALYSELVAVCGVSMSQTHEPGLKSVVQTQGDPVVPLLHPSIGLRSKRVRSRSEMVKQVSFRSEGVNGNMRVKGCQEAGVKAFFSSLLFFASVSHNSLRKS